MPVSAALSQGALAFHLLVAGGLTLVLGAVLVRLYRRAVDRAMRVPGQPAPDPPRMRAAAPPPLEFQIADASAPDGAGTLSRAARRRFAWAAAVYAGAGLAHAAVATVLLFLFAGLDFYPWRTAVVFWALAWPVVLVLNLASGPDRRWQLATVGGYFMVLALLSLGVAASGVQPMVIGGLSLPAVAQPLMLWLIKAAPGIFLLVFLNRRIRSIGPLLLVMMLVAALGAHAGFLAMHLSGVQRLLVEVALATGIGIATLFAAIQLAGFALFMVPGWAVAAWLRRRYRAKRISDQMITFDAVWLLMTLVECSALATEQGGFGWAGLLAFAAYRLVVGLGLRPLHRAALSEPPARLLLLRVFGAQRQSERLFDLLGARWRYRGSLQLIAGTDLATTTIEPHEFLDFLSRPPGPELHPWAGRSRAAAGRARPRARSRRPLPDQRILLRCRQLAGRRRPPDGGERSGRDGPARLLGTEPGLHLRAAGVDRQRADRAADRADRPRQRPRPAPPDPAWPLAADERRIAERARRTGAPPAAAGRWRSGRGGAPPARAGRSDARPGRCRQPVGATGSCARLVGPRRLTGILILAAFNLRSGASAKAALPQALITAISSIRRARPCGSAGPGGRARCCRPARSR